MTLAQYARAVNKELARLGVRWHRERNPDGLVARPESGRKPAALRMGCEWFTAVYHAEALLELLCELAFNSQDEEVFWKSGRFWAMLAERNIEMLEARA